MKSFYELEEYALVKDVPIMQKEGIEYVTEKTINFIPKLVRYLSYTYKKKKTSYHLYHKTI